MSFGALFFMFRQHLALIYVYLFFTLVVCCDVFGWCALWSFERRYIGGGAMGAKVQKGELKFLFMFIFLRVGQWV
jgi:hypothetical protein